MSDKQKCKKSISGNKKKRQNKRQASSPLNDNGDNSEFSFTSVTGNNGKSSEQKKVKPKKKCKQDCQDIRKDSNCGYNFAASFPNYYQTMTYQPQSTAFNMSQPMSQPSFVSSPPGHFGNNSFGFQNIPPQPGPPLPPWATKLLEDMEHVKQKLQGVDEIKKTVNLINVKVTDMETQLKSLDLRVTQNENSCSFISETNEKHKQELKAANDALSKLQKNYEKLQNDSQQLKRDNEVLDESVGDLRTRFMRPNLLFYGIPEGGEGENCERLVRDMCVDVLDMRGDLVQNMTLIMSTESVEGPGLKCAQL